MIIDSHVHIGRGNRLNDTYQLDAFAEDIIAQMDEAGVDKSGLMSVALDDYEEGNQEVRAAIAKYPGRFFGYARANLKDQDRAFEQIRRCFEEYDFRGLKNQPGLGDGFPTRPLMELLSEYGKPMLVHGTVTPEFIDANSKLARAYPKVPIICAHMGGFSTFYPSFVKLYAVEAKHIPNLYLDTAFVYLHQWIKIGVDICGPEKVLFGSDGPVAHPAVTLKQIEVCHFTDSERELILHGNAKRLFGL